MREGAWLRLRCPRIWGVIVALLVVGGCAGESRRTGSVGASTHPIAPAPSAVWVPLPVVQADAEAVDDGLLVTVTTRIPGENWRVRLEDLPPTEPSTREFRVVGQGPGGVQAASGSSPGKRIIREIVPVDEKVTEIVVEGSDGAVVFGTE